EIPLTASVRRQFEDSSVSDVRVSGRAVEIARVVEDQSAVRSVSILRAEAIENVLRPARAGVDELKDCAGVACSSIGGGSVEIAGGIEQESALRLRAVGNSGEAIEHALSPSGAG